MAINLINSINSFIRFSEEQQPPYCIWGYIFYNLPVYEQSDIAFQFIIEGTSSEIDAICTPDASEVTVSLVSDCDGPDLIVFPNKPQRFRLSETQMLYNWSHGLPNFTSVVGANECFSIKILIDGVKFCSNYLERIIDNCFTSVVEYGNNGDAFGFKYCNSGSVDELPTICEPTTISFINVPTVTIPYTASLRSKYGDFPTVQAWVYDDSGQLVNMGITIAFDTYPPTLINLDFGGNSTGIIIIR